MILPWWLQLLALAVALLGLMMSLVCFKHIRQLRSRLTDARNETYLLVKALRNETHAMGSGAIGVGQRLVEVEKRLNNTVERQMEIEQRDPGSLPYAYAVRLVEMGATTEDLINNCGLARVEAELITLVHSELKKQKEQPVREEHYTLN
ncbi:DUF2802 domain-containing protein [Marinospirillum alkaliphilum]|uniref:DUF2802 domain-containing protein n=1 Tax=Marinospirillum alkaliphilum DSM 21637 TaxID=1122209 RepID=A0A1K1VD84_9GAMM|nr:DUF2802 domain-containing protein [Marinospirillum alkaliphilum]SFX22667.1 Protein of unknown function [Marinospirillum alkaliphilum DSM 21637]